VLKVTRTWYVFRKTGHNEIIQLGKPKSKECKKRGRLHERKRLASCRARRRQIQVQSVLLCTLGEKQLQTAKGRQDNPEKKDELERGKSGILGFGLPGARSQGPIQCEGGENGGSGPAIQVREQNLPYKYTGLDREVQGPEEEGPARKRQKTCHATQFNTQEVLSDYSVFS